MITHVNMHWSNLLANDGEDIFSRIYEQCSIENATRVAKFGGLVCAAYCIQKLCTSYYVVSAAEKFKDLNNKINTQKKLDQEILVQITENQKSTKKNNKAINNLQNKMFELQNSNNTLLKTMNPILYGAMSSAKNSSINLLLGQVKSTKKMSNEITTQLENIQKKLQEQNVCVQSKLTELKKVFEDQKNLKHKETETAERTFTNLSNEINELKQNIVRVGDTIGRCKQIKYETLEKIQQHSGQLKSQMSQVLFEAYLEQARSNSRVEYNKYVID